MPKSASKILISLLFSSLLLACGDTTDSANTPPSVTIQSVVTAANNSDSTFQDLQGGSIELSDYLGKKIVLNYWATWCAPCIRELPALNRAAEILNEEGFVFLFASDESIADIAEFVSEHEFEGNFIKLNSFFASYGVEAVPSTILFNTSGEAINSWLGEYEWDNPEVLAVLREAN